MTATHSRALWRWLVLVAIVANVAFNYISNAVGIHGDTVGSVARSYPNLFAPAPWAFSIWGLIYAAFIAWAVAGLLPRNRKVAHFDRLAPPLALANVLASLWIAVFEARLMILSVAIISVMLALAIFMFVDVHRAQRGGLSRWATVPFALFMGWISVAIIANTTVMLVSLGWRGGPIPEPTIAAIMTAIAGLIGVAVAIRFRDFVVPAVIAWATFALHADNGSNVALGAFIVNAATALTVAISLIHIRYSHGSRGGLPSAR